MQFALYAVGKLARGPSEATVPHDAIAHDALVLPFANAVLIKPDSHQQPGRILTLSRSMRRAPVQHRVVVGELYVAWIEIELEHLRMCDLVEKIENLGVFWTKAQPTSFCSLPHPSAIVAAGDDASRLTEYRYGIVGRWAFARAMFILPIPDEAAIQPFERVGPRLQQPIVDGHGAGQAAFRRVFRLPYAE